MTVIRRIPVDLGAVEHGIDHLESEGNFDAAAAVRHLREENFALARQLAGTVSVADVEQLLSDTSRYFSGDHVNAGVVVGEMRKRLRALGGDNGQG
jgi:Fe2+ transport system protein FeoA